MTFYVRTARQTNKHETVSGSDSISSEFIYEKIIQKNQKFSRNALHTKKWKEKNEKMDQELM